MCCYVINKIANWYLLLLNIFQFFFRTHRIVWGAASTFSLIAREKEIDLFVNLALNEPMKTFGIV